MLVATHPDAPSVSCRKNVVGEYASQDADRLVGKILSEFGNVFNIHAHAFIIDTNAAANSPSMKAFKVALSDFKTEIIDVRIIKLRKIRMLEMTMLVFSRLARHLRSAHSLCWLAFLD